MKDWTQLFTPNINAILSGGKKSILPKPPVQFGVPGNNQLPQPVLPQVANTTPTQRTPGGSQFLPAEVVRAVVQGTARSAVSIGQYGAGRALGMTPEVASKLEFVPDNAFKRALFGKEPVSVKSEAIDPLISLGASPEAANRFGAPLLVALTALDLATGGGKKKLLEKAMVGANDLKKARTVLRNAGINDGLITTFKWDQKVVDIKTPQEADAFIKSIQETSNKLKNTPENVAQMTDDTVVLENLQNLDPMDITEGSGVRFADLKRTAQNRGLSNTEINEARTLIEANQGALPRQTITPQIEAQASRARGGVSDIKRPTATAQPEAVPTPRLDNQSVSSANLSTEAPLPVNQKLADFKAGRPSMQGGYVANPFANRVMPKENIFNPKMIAPTEIPNYKRLTSNKVFTRLREVVQDSWVRAKKLQQQKGVVTKEGANPYMAETLFHGRVHTRLEETRDVIKNIDLDIVASSKKLQVPNSTFSKDVNEFLQSQHAPERNAKLGDGAAGMTTAEAEANLARIKNSPQGKEVVRIANQLSDLNKRVVEVLKDSQVISNETYKTLTDTYKNHVPLNRVMDETEDISQALTGAGFNVRGTGIQRAKGSSREVSDIITNITSNVQQAVIRAEKNLVDLNTLNFARNNKDLGLFEVIKPKAIGTDFSGKPIIEKITDPSVLALRENGKPIYVKVNDPKLAVMYQNLNAEQMPSWLQFIGIITRTYAGLHTRFNYEFAFSNKLRDIQDMAIDMASRKEMGFKQAGKSITKEPESVLAVTDFLRGKDTVGSKLYQQMKLDGGTTGGLSLSTRADIEIDIESIRKLNRSKPRQAAEKVIRAVDAWNTLFEDSTRLSVYKTALKNGSSRTEAAMLAKESTVNFNKKGTGGTVINSFYMFANASIQGTTKMLRAMKNPKVAATVVSGVSLGVYSVNEHNTKVDPNWRDKVSSFDRTSNLVILLPTADGKEASFIKLPLSYGIKPIKVAAEQAYDFMSGYNTSVADAAAGIAVAVATSYNPLAGDESIVRTLTPTIGKTAIEIQANRAWHGGRIRPDFNDNLPDSAQYFDSLSRTQTGKMAISATESLSEKGIIEVSPANVIYSYNAIIGGAGRSISKLFNTGAAVVTGETLEPKEVPIASRFFGTLSSEQSETGEIYKVKEEQDTLKADRQVKTERLYQEIKDLPKAQLKARLQELGASDPEMLDKVIDKLSAPELTSTEKAIKSLDNKARAVYIDKKLRAMPKAERRAYMANLIAQGVVTDATLEELERMTIEK